MVPIGRRNLFAEKGRFLMSIGGVGFALLLTMLGCLLRPATGRIVIDGLDATALPATELSKVRRSLDAPRPPPLGGFPLDPLRRTADAP